MSNTFVCEACGFEFEKAVTDEEAMAEMKELWGDLPPEEQALICDDCFTRLMRNLTN